MSQLSRVFAFVTVFAWISWVGSNARAQAPAATDPVKHLKEALEKETTVDYLDTPLEDVATDLELRHKITIRVDPEAQPRNPLPGQQKFIKGSVRKLPLAVVLDEVLTPQKLTWAVQSGVLVITPDWNETKYVEAKVYAVGDIDTELQTVSELIQKTIAPDSWRKTDDRPPGLIELHEPTKALVITQTSRNHRQIAKLVDDSRAAKGKVAK